MNELLTDWGIDPAWLVKAVFEANMLLLFGICLAHSLRTHGWQRTLREFVGGFLLTALCESAGVLSGAYVYPGFEFYILATPVANPVGWVALVYIIMTLTDRLVFGRKALDTLEKPLRDRKPMLLRGSLMTTVLLLALCDGLLAVMLDLVLDPLATIYNWWIWVPVEPGVHTIETGVVDAYNFDHPVWMSTPDNPVAGWFSGYFPEGNRYPTRVFGIPLINFIAWLVFVFVFTSQFRWIESQQQWSEWKKTLVLWGSIVINVPVLCFVLIAPNL